MIQRLSIKKLAELILEDTEQLLTPVDIWEKAMGTNREQIKKKVKVMKQGKTPWDSISAEIYIDLKKPNSVFYQPHAGIKKFCLLKYKSKFSH